MVIAATMLRNVRQLIYYPFNYLGGMVIAATMLRNVRQLIYRQFGSTTFQNMVHKFIMKDITCFQ